MVKMQFIFVRKIAIIIENASKTLKYHRYVSVTLQSTNSICFVYCDDGFNKINC